MDKNRVIMIGSGCMDEYYELSYIPKMGEKTICKPLKSRVGGMIGNAASVAAAYGMETYLMDTVNRSINSRRVLKDCKKQKIRLDLIRFDDRLPDVKCIIFLKDGERVIYVIPTQKNRIEADPAQEEIIREAGYVYSTVAELRCFADPEGMIDRIRSQGTKLVLDVEYLDPERLRSEWGIIRRGDIIFVNSEGDRQLTDYLSKSYMKMLLEAGSMVIKTRGSEGCEICEGDRKTVIPAYRITPVDTTGAGDTFNSSFVYGLSKGWNVQEAGEFASAAAARAIRHMGPRSGAVGAERVRDFMNTYKEVAL